MNEDLARTVREVGSLPDDDPVGEDSTYITTDSPEFAFVNDCSETCDDALLVFDFSYLDESRTLETFSVSWIASMKYSVGLTAIRI